jgi:Radical SAM superfamily
VALARQRGKPVVVGGPDVSLSPDAYADADFRVLGEAETIIEAFIAAWDNGERRGLFEAARAVTDVTKTPVPRFDLLKRSQYLYLGVQFSRGCPFNCEFCDIAELYGRVSRTKTTEQMLAELEALYQLRYRGHVDFVDDNLIGNKLSVKALLPHLIARQKARGYPFGFSTEASINLADDDTLLALIREAGSFTVFVGIESPDTDTLVSIQKKQNTRRDLARGVEKIHRAGMFVNGGFIVGFDSEKGSVADAMIGLIQNTGIPVPTVGLLYALPKTQMANRLAAEGRAVSRLLPGSAGQFRRRRSLHRRAEFRDAAAPGRDSARLSPGAARGLFGARLLRARAEVDPDARPSRPDGGSELRAAAAEAAMAHRVGRDRRLEVAGPAGLAHRAAAAAGTAAFCRRVHSVCAAKSARARVCRAALYLHLGPFARYVIRKVDELIAQIDAGDWRSPLVDARMITAARFRPEQKAKKNPGREAGVLHFVHSYCMWRWCRGQKQTRYRPTSRRS